MLCRRKIFIMACQRSRRSAIGICSAFCNASATTSGGDCCEKLLFRYWIGAQSSSGIARSAADDLVFVGDEGCEDCAVFFCFGFHSATIGKWP